MKSDKRPSAHQVRLKWCVAGSPHYQLMIKEADGESRNLRIKLNHVLGLLEIGVPADGEVFYHIRRNVASTPEGSSNRRRWEKLSWLDPKGEEGDRSE